MTSGAINVFALVLRLYLLALRVYAISLMHILFSVRKIPHQNREVGTLLRGVTIAVAVFPVTHASKEPLIWNKVPWPQAQVTNSAAYQAAVPQERRKARVRLDEACGPRRGGPCDMQTSFDNMNTD